MKINALAVPTRRVIFEALKAGPTPVGVLAARLPVSRPAVSQHLKVLKDAGLVTERRDGVKRLYQIDRAGLREIRDYFDGFWDRALDAFERSLDAKDA